jgi:copper(I)-binding protein
MAQLHETLMAANSEGVMLMSMNHVMSIDVPANGEVALEPGGFHVMLMNLTEPLVVGAEFDVTLTFESAGDMVVTAEVRDS